jgi:hypothetical protein
MSAEIQRDEYMPTLAIRYTPMQVRPTRLSVYTTKAALRRWLRMVWR